LYNDVKCAKWRKWRIKNGPKNAESTTVVEEAALKGI
jgi:hypothetical protein